MQANTIAAEVIAALAGEPAERRGVEALARACGRSLEDTRAACALLELWGLVVRTESAQLVLAAPVERRKEPIVLVVENTAAVAHVVGALLESEGYRVLIAESLPVGLTVAGMLSVALVISDSFSGTAQQALERLRPLRDTALPAPLLIFTAHRDLTEDSARSAGYAGILPKPFDIDDLLVRVADAVKR